MKKHYKNYLMIICIFIANLAFADVTVNGFCYLEGAGNHSGTKVLFNAVSASAVTDSVYTNTDGSYLLELPIGIYTVHFSHDGWQPYIIPGELFFFENTTLDDVMLSSGSIEEVFGPQSGVWPSGNLYHVIGDISVPNDETLIIEPGVTIKFIDYYSFTISGTLIAIGTETDSIFFTSPYRIPGDWSEIKFENSSIDSSIISFACIEYANYGIYCHFSSPTISNNTICYNNEYGIYSYSSSSTISSNVISNNINHGITCIWASPTIINNTIINNNSRGIYCSYIESMPIICNNTISNHTDGIWCYSSSPTIFNNTINNNYYGIYCRDESSPTILNNILYENNYGIGASSTLSSLEYNLFWGNVTAASGDGLPTAFGIIITVNANGDPCDTYCNLFMDPLFVDPGNFNFHLTENSPCIDAGNPDPVYYDPDGTIADMGALYFDQSQIPLVANFTGNITSGDAPLNVQFTDLSTTQDSITSWQWDFENDGTIDSYEQNPEWTYNEIGIYSVSLSISDGTNEDTELKENYITVHESQAPYLVSLTPGIEEITLEWEAITEAKTNHFNFGGGDPSGNLWTIYIAGAEFDGIGMEAGDEIAVFDDDLLVGVITLTQVCTPDNQFENFLIAFSVLAGTVPGYQAGNAFTFVAWDESAGVESTGFTYIFDDTYGDAWVGDTFPIDVDAPYSMAEITFTGGYIPTYNIYYEDGTLVASELEENTYTDTDLIAGQEYCYYVTQILESGEESNPSNVLCATPTGNFGTQTYYLETGFQFISSRFIPENPDMLVVVEEILNENLDFVRNSQGQTLRKIGPNWVNGIGEWIIEEGYLVKMFADDSFIIEGDVVDPATPIQLATGFQFVSYFPTIPMDALIAFETIIGDDLVFIRNSQGQTIRKIGPNWVNGIGDCQPGEGYLIKMYADDILIYTGSSSFICGDPFTDPRDEQTYETVQIGDQCWMAENLNIGIMINGSDNMNDDGIIEKYCYDNNTSDCEEYGGLYQWNEMMEYTVLQGAQGICPNGWYIPSDDEWTTLTDFLGGESVAGGKMKEAGTTHWFPPNTGATNESGFTALPGGYRDIVGNLCDLTYNALFWSSSENSSSHAWNRYLNYSGDAVHRYFSNKEHGFSVRCVQDNSIFDNLSIQEKNLSYELTGQKHKNMVAPYFLFEGGNAADPVYTIYVEGLEIGDEVAAYDGDVLVGAKKINSQNTFENELPVFSILSSGVGYEEGNPIIIKVWDKSENKEYILSDYTFSNPYGDAWIENVFPAEDGEYSLLHFSTTGLSDENEMNQVISIYPNPSEGLFNISIKGVSGEVQIKVFDVHGNNYRHFEIREARNIIKEQIDLKELHSGVYFISFSSKDFSKIKRIVIH